MEHFKRHILILSMVACLAACKKETPPPGVLSPHEFSKVLVEVYLAEARMNSIGIQRDSALKVFVPYEEKLFQQLGFPDSVMRITFQYYVDNPKQLEMIYDSVIDTLSLREKKLRTKPADTLRKEKKIRKPENL